MAAPNVTVLKLLGEQRKRCLATILNHAEGSTWWVQLSTAQQGAFRDAVRGGINVFYDLTRDIVKVTEDDDSMRNEVVLELIRAIHEQQTRIEASLRQP